MDEAIWRPDQDRHGVDLKPLGPIWGDGSACFEDWVADFEEGLGGIAGFGAGVEGWRLVYGLGGLKRAFGHGFCLEKKL